LLTGIHGHQKNALAFFVIGIVVSGSAVLQRVAESLSLQGMNPAKMTSIERRLARFLSNERVVVTKIWEQFLAQACHFGMANRCVLSWIAHLFVMKRPLCIWVSWSTRACYQSPGP
jgi:hypothetical protein